MKTNQKNILPIFNSPSSTSSQPACHSLQDSKSTSNLYQTTQQNKKFRETTYFPATAKNTNRQFLRYTVNFNKSDQQTIQPTLVGNSSVRIQRKLTMHENHKKILDDPETSNLLVKQNSINKNTQKKPTIYQKKQQSSCKNSTIPKFLQKKLYSTPSADTPTDKHSGQRVVQPCPALNGANQQKKTFTPKCNKTIQQQSPSNKINVCYSSSDLLKNNHISSPTCQSLNSTGIQNECFGTVSHMSQSANGSTHSIGNNVKLDDFKKVKYLGEGKFGQVFLVSHIKSFSIYALKQIKKQMIIKNKMQEQLLMQIKMQFFFNHPNILKMYGVFNDEQNIYLILQYMEEGTLYSLLKKKKTLKQIDASHKLRDVLDGVYYLHSHNIAHRDIKPQNIVISNDVCKICDFGWAALCEERRKTLCGTIDYASPQLLQGKQYGVSIDLWCLGVLCYELMVGKCPFYHISRKQTMKKIINADISDINLPNTIQAQTKDFIVKLLVKNPDQRMSAETALIHPLITKHYDQDLQDIRNIPKRKL